MISDDLGGYPTVLQEGKHDLQIKSANAPVDGMVRYAFFRKTVVKYPNKAELPAPLS